MYDNNRFICVTGDLLSNNTELKDCTDTICDINRQFIGVRAEPVFITRTQIDWSPSDSELVEMIRESKIAERFERLFNGTFTGDHSSADFAFCSMLAWWTQDAAQIDRIFRCSGLYRAKWDSRRGNSTYGANLIESAIQSQSSRYEPKVQKKIIYKTQSEM